MVEFGLQATGVVTTEWTLQMRCPYCAEEIKDEALVCRFCRRDLILLKAMLDRLSKIEATVSELRTISDDGQEQHEIGRPSSIATNAVNKCVIAVAASVVLAFIFYWISWLPFASYDRPWQILSVASPFFAALSLGLALPRLQLTSYALLGLIAGFTGYIEMLLLYCHRVQGNLPSNWRTASVYYVVSAALFFLSGGRIGEQVRLRLRGEGSGPRTSGGFAHSFVLPMLGDSEKARSLAKGLGEFASLLTAIAGMVTAIKGLPK